MGSRDGEEIIMRWVVAFVFLLGSTTAMADEHVDPWESMNRKVYKFNDFADRNFVKPAARTYQKIPDPVRFSIDNVYGNLSDVGDAVNNLLQGKVGDSAKDVARVLINTSVGIGGLFDPASRMGLPDHDEDFAQTLATWGVPKGPYLVIPILGPCTLRDAFARPVNNRLDPLIYLHPVNHRNITYGARLLHERADLLVAEEVMFGDRYLFLRDAYLQRREFLEKDGEIDEDPFGDEF